MKRFVLLLLLIYPLARFCHHQTKGFRFSKLEQNTSCLENQISEPMPPELQSACHQTFTYLGRGLQSFSFVSEDGQMVLKIFNNRYRRKLYWLQFPLVRHLSKEKIAYLRHKWEKTFFSYQISAENLREESGLLYFHPSSCRDCPTITLVDPLGSPHQISLSNYAFVLQKKAQGSFDFFLECSRDQDLARTKQGIDSLIALMKKKATLGIADDDPLIRTNIGFLSSKAMQIDLGPFSRDPKVQNPKFQQKEMIRILSGLRTFMEKNTPNLLPCLDEAIETL